MPKKSKKVLFILKKFKIYKNYNTNTSGLYNSAKFINGMLNENNIKSNIVEVIDNNEIDKFVTKYKPDIVIIEALWVVPSKFKVLQELHPNVKWIVRVHSELPFIANEGIAIDWLKKYTEYDNVKVASNSKDFIKSMTPILKEKIQYLPNYYPISKYKCRLNRIKYKSIIDVGLFGSIRPMKNVLTQAVAAITYAEKNNKLLCLHINIIGADKNVLKNIRSLFKNNNHMLEEHGWYNHNHFIKLVSYMDIGLQVSLSETYNIVAADFISQGVSIVTSNEINFVNCFSKVNTNKNSKKIVKKMKISLIFNFLLTPINLILLKFNSYKSKKKWLNKLIN